MVYTYYDDFVFDSLPTDELEKLEADAIKEVDLLGITDEYFREKLVRARVCMMASTHQVENDGFEQKYRYCEKEYAHYLDLAKKAGALGEEGAGAEELEAGKPHTVEFLRG